VRSLARSLALVLALAAGAAGAQGLKPWTGGPTPTLALADLQGRAHRLEQYRGKVVLVNFWATWCEPCRDEMPSMRELRKSLAGKPFEVLAVNLAEPETRIERFLEKVPLDFPVLLDRDTKTARAWQARILPASFVISPDGRIRYHHAGEIDWSKEEVRRLIAGLLPR
jgi:thiol-disulfide isomerase/thioredoxin